MPSFLVVLMVSGEILMFAVVCTVIHFIEDPIVRVMFALLYLFFLTRRLWRLFYGEEKD